MFTSPVVCSIEWPRRPSDVEQERMTMAMVTCDIYTRWVVVLRGIAQ